jgi:tripartite-type tricarboxylate transporter receptor subunit TctC
MKSLNPRHRLGAACLAALVAALPGAAAADAVADFYKGKEIKVIVGGTAEGGYAPYARMLQRSMGQFIPGNPVVITQFMPGGGGLVAANYVYNAAPKDGTVIGAVQRSIVRLAMFGDKKVKYDPAKINWLGSLHNDVSVCVAWHTSPVKTIQDAVERELIVGATSPNNDTGQFPVVLNKIVGTKFKVISGYHGGGAISLAIERGELGGRCGWSWDSLKTQQGDWVRDKKVNVLTQLTLKPHPELAGVPMATELAKTDEQRGILEFIFSEQILGKPFMFAAGVPADRVAAVRKAFMQTAEDKKALEQMAAMDLDVNLLDGDEMEKVVTKIIATPPDVVKRARDAMTVAEK